MTALTPATRQRLTAELVRDLHSGKVTRDELLRSMDRQVTNPDAARAYGKPIGEAMGPTQLAHFSTLMGDAVRGGALVNATRDVLTSGVGSGYSYVREDVDPTLTALFVQDFPLFGRLRRIYANGIHHSYNVITGPDTADFSWATELQAAPIGQAPPTRMTAPVALGLTARGASFLEREAVRQSGMTYDGGKSVVDLELERGMEAVAYGFQLETLQGETVTAGKTGTDEYGTYAAAGFNGFRAISGNPAGAFNSLYAGSTTAINMDQGGLTLTAAINTIARRQRNVGRKPTAVVLSSGALEMLMREGSNIETVLSQDVGGGITLGVPIMGINTVAGRLDIVEVPGTTNGQYTPATGTYNGVLAEDVYVLAERDLAYACIGSLNPFMIQIAMGVDLTLADRHIIAFAAGLVAFAPNAIGKIRIPAVV